MALRGSVLELGCTTSANGVAPASSGVRVLCSNSNKDLLLTGSLLSRPRRSPCSSRPGAASCCRARIQSR